MDYTLSNGFVTDAGTGNRMHLQAQAVPTAVSDLDMNQVIWSLMEVVKAAGLAGAQFDKTVPATYQKLLTALRSAGVFATPSQFDATTKAATMAALQRALGNNRGVLQISGSTVLAAADVGNVVEVYGDSASTQTLPLLSSCPPGASFDFLNVCTVAGLVAIVAQGADKIIGNSAAGTTSITLRPGDTARLVKADASTWILTGGTAQLAYSGGLFGASLAQSGYQKLPSGLIIQWGQITAAVNSTTTVTLPIAFPAEFWHVWVTVQDNIATGSSSPFSAGLPLSQGTFSLRSYYSGSSIRNSWLAFGR